MAQAQREWFEKDYYKVLGVPESATEKEITRAYRKLAKQYHPDANPGAEDKFKEVSAAYDVLGDADKRKEYDEVRRLGPMAGRFAGFGGNGDGFSGTSFRIDDLGDLLGGLFNRGRARAAGPQRGQDVEASLHLSFEDAIRGVTAPVNVTSDAACSTCSGTGAAPGTSPVICSACGGRGVRDENQGLFSFSQPCRVCGGTGMRIETPCPTCSGSGIVHRAREVKVRVPAGVENGQRIRVKGRGGAGQNGGPSGDLYVNVHVAPHSTFGRRGRNLTVKVPVTFPEATLGSTVTVPTLDGTVTLRIPAGTPNGKTFRVKAHGVPTANGVGDLLVTVEVAVPKHLSDEEREAVERLAEVMKTPKQRQGADG